MIKEKNGNKDYYREKTGLPMATYFSAFKFKWMIENVPQIKEKIQGKNFNDLCFGTIDAWMMKFWKTSAFRDKFYLKFMPPQIFLAEFRKDIWKTFQ